MNPIARNILAVIVGFVVGAVVNSVLVNIGPMIIPNPEGTDTSTVEGVREAIAAFGPQHFIVPFVAHALGTLVGAFIAAKLAASHKMKFALGIGVFFLLGGITMVALVGGPIWFILLDLIVAYIPMGYLGGKLAGGK